MRDIGLRGQPDTKVFEAAITTDAIIVTRDKGFVLEKSWPVNFTAGVIFVNLPDQIPASTISDKIIKLLKQRLAVSLLGALTIVELRRALSRTV